MSNSIPQVPNDGYGVSTSVVMNLEAEEMKKLTSMLKSHDPGDEVCINSFNDNKASNMDVRLYTWSIDPVMTGLLGAESENKGMLVVEQRREEIDLC